MSRIIVPPRRSRTSGTAAQAPTPAQSAPAAPIAAPIAAPTRQAPTVAAPAAAAAATAAAATAAPAPTPRTVSSPVVTASRRKLRFPFSKGTLAKMFVAAAIAGYAGNFVYKTVYPTPDTAPRRVVKVDKETFAEYQQAGQHLVKAAAVIDKHLCFKKTASGYDTCQTIKDLKTLTDAFGTDPQSAGQLAYQTLVSIMELSYINSMFGDKSLLDRIDGTADKKFATLAKATALNDPLGYQVPIEMITEQTVALLNTLKNQNEKLFNGEMSKLPNVKDLYETIPGGSKAKICWGIATDSEEWKDRACKTLPLQP